MKKRFLSIVLALSMLMAFMPVIASAAIVDSGKCGENVTWTLDSNGTLTISGTGEMEDSSFREDRLDIKSVVIETGVTSIGVWAFHECSNLKSVIIPDSVTTIHELVFDGCSSLTSVKLSNNVTDIGYGMFKNCSSLTNINIPDGVTTINSMAFLSCISLTNIYIPDSVTEIWDFAFENCSNLTDVYYRGTKEQWQSISFNVANEALTDATIHYNSHKSVHIIPLEVEPIEPDIDTENSTITFSVTVTDESRADELAEINVYVAEYDGDGRFTGLTLGKKGEINGDTIIITADIPDAEEYKFLLWDKNNVPLMDAVDKGDIPVETPAPTAEPTVPPTPTPSPEPTVPPTPTPFPTLAPGEKIKIMPLGDSITEGFTVNGAYRNKLGELLVQNGLSQYVDFVGSQSNGSAYDTNHEGHSGWAIDAVPKNKDIEGKGRYGLTTNIESWMDTSKPDIVLLQIGTNDILSLYDLDNAPLRLEILVDMILAKLPGSGKLYIAKIPYISQTANYNKTGKSQAELDEIVDTYNTAVAALAEEKGLTLVDINGVLALSDLKDGIHPTADGYAKMGDLWYNTLEAEIRMRAGI